MIGILDLRSLGYYKIQQGVLQQNLSKFYNFELAGECVQSVQQPNKHPKEGRNNRDRGKYPWFDNTDERKYLSHREILEKYIDLSNPCLHRKQKEEVIDVLYKYKEVFSLRDEIGTCPNIEVEINVTDKSQFFIRPYHVREEDKKVIDMEMKCLCY